MEVRLGAYLRSTCRVAPSGMRTSRQPRHRRNLETHLPAVAPWSTPSTASPQTRQAMRGPSSTTGASIGGMPGASRRSAPGASGGRLGATRQSFGKRRWLTKTPSASTTIQRRSFLRARASVVEGVPRSGRRRALEAALRVEPGAVVAHALAALDRVDPDLLDARARRPLRRRRHVVDARERADDEARADERVRGHEPAEAAPDAVGREQAREHLGADEGVGLHDLPVAAVVLGHLLLLEQAPPLAPAELLLRRIVVLDPAARRVCDVLHWRTLRRASSWPPSRRFFWHTSFVAAPRLWQVQQKNR